MIYNVMVSSLCCDDLCNNGFTCATNEHKGLNNVQLFYLC